MVLHFAVIVLLASAFAIAGVESRQCMFLYREVRQMEVLHPDDTEDVGETTNAEPEVDDLNRHEIECSKDSDFCYTLWQETTVANETVSIIIAQGCWESSGKVDCERSECISDKKPPKALTNGKFCCCSSNLCNTNFTDIYVPTTEEAKHTVPATQYLEQDGVNHTIVIVVVVPFVFVLGLIIVVCKTRQLIYCSRKPAPDSVHLMEAPQLQSTYNMDNLKLSEIIGQGRYGSVWWGSVSDQEVAVKVFPRHHRQYFLNERDIYMLPFMEHPALLKYFGSDERTGINGNHEYCLVLSYVPYGSLVGYLRNNTVSWQTFCKMSLSIAKGLSHLHTEIRKGDKVKPCISHRDLNSKNILVKSDLTCCLCDLGFAMKIAGSKYFYNGEEQNAETKSITDVGTLRYMAPEGLEGAVNLRDCESSLKQIDIYCLGLVLWEISTRCSDLYRQSDVPPFALPFEVELGGLPTFEQMQVLVSHNKARPLFPATWKDGNPAVRSLKETIEDCWDQDAEARLTSLCVEERLRELPTLWDRYKASTSVPGTSPTVNSVSGSYASRSIINGTSHMPAVANGNIDLTGNGMKSLLLNKDQSNSNGQNRSQWDKSVSETTAETTLTMSPVDQPSFINSLSTKNLQVSQVPTGLQPHQGRNPCLERNLVRQMSEEPHASGNVLVDVQQYQLSSPSPLASTSPEESRALLTNDYLNQSTRFRPPGSVARPATPIPYVQNAVHGMPKQHNVPGNGRQHMSEQGKQSPHAKTRWKGWGNIRRILNGKRKSSSKNNRTFAEENYPSSVSRCQAEVWMVGEKAVTVTRPSAIFSPEVEANSRQNIPPCEESTVPLVIPARRPNSLLLEGNNCHLLSSRRSSLDGVKDVFSKETSGLRDSRNRVHTPYDTKRGRFSLYDDRMMEETGLLPLSTNEKTTRFSSSMPICINAIEGATYCGPVQTDVDEGDKPSTGTDKPLSLYHCNVSSF